MSDLQWWYSGKDGPSNWHRFCTIGDEQSPIDVVARVSTKLPEISFSYAEGPLKLYNHNHTIKAGPFEDCSVTMEGVSYQLEDIHFHSPSEHLINSKGFPLEVHFVHAGEGGEQMVISVFIEEGEAGKDFSPLIESFERFMLRKEGDDSLLIDPLDFIPQDTAYYTYTGSHTSPPCTEGVRWLVMRDPFKLPGAMVERLRRVVGENCRPVQPLNGRVIEASF